MEGTVVGKLIWAAVGIATFVVSRRIYDWLSAKYPIDAGKETISQQEYDDLKRKSTEDINKIRNERDQTRASILPLARNTWVTGAVNGATEGWVAINELLIRIGLQSYPHDKISPEMQTIKNILEKKQQGLRSIFDRARDGKDPEFPHIKKSFGHEPKPPPTE